MSNKGMVVIMTNRLPLILVSFTCYALVTTGCTSKTEPEKPVEVQRAGEKPKADEKPKVGDIPLDKWDVADVEKKFGLKFKSVTFKGDEYTFVIEFSRELKADELKELQGVFTLSGPGVKSASNVSVVYFDKDNVILQKSPYCNARTELSGKKGEAFQLTAYPPRTSFLEPPRILEAVRAEIRFPQ